MQKQRRTRFTVMLSYSSLSISGAIIINFFNTRIYNFYTDEIKLNIAYIPIVMTIYAIFNALNDPLFGWISDKTRTRFGRRFPYILFGFIPLTIAFAAIWLVPISLVGDINHTFYFNSQPNLLTSVLTKFTFLNPNQTLLLISVIATLLIFDTLYTIVILNWHSLFPEKFKTAKERNIVSALRQVVSIIGVSVAVVFAPMLFDYNNLLSYRKAILFISGFVLVGFLLSMYGCKEVPNNTQKIKNTESYKKSFLEVLKNKNMIVFLVSFFLANVAYLTLMSMIPYMNKWILKQPAEFESYLYGVGVLVAGLAFFLWVKVSLKIGTKAVFIISSVGFSLGLLILLFDLSLPIALITMGVVGLPLAGLLLIPEILLSEVIDEDYKKFGKRREGMFFGFYGFCVRIAIIVESSIIALILSLTGYDANALEQTALAKTGIKILLIAVPIVCFIFGVILMLFFYDLSRKKLEKEKGKKLSIFF